MKHDWLLHELDWTCSEALIALKLQIQTVNEGQR